MLNRCFDEIEQFMSRLQSVADAFKELEKRRRNRKKKNPVTGGLVLLFEHLRQFEVLSRLDSTKWFFIDHSINGSTI